jgi:hypothetical protein
MIRVRAWHHPVTVPQQLPHIAILPARHPDPRKVIFQHEFQNQLRILAIRLLLAYSLAADLSCVPDPQLKVQLRQQPFKPARMPTRFHPHAHLHSLGGEIAVELLPFLAVLQLPLPAVAGVSIHKCKSIFSSAARLQVGEVARNLGRRAGELKMYWAKPPRWACPKFLRQNFHEWAGHSIAQSSWARTYYQLQRQRGKGHHAAVRPLAFKWIRIVFRCWKDGVACDENRYLATLIRRGSPLGAFVIDPVPATM